MRRGRPDGESLPVAKSVAVARRRRLAARPARRARSWERSSIRAPGAASSSSTGTRDRRSAQIAAGLAERQAETAFQVGLRGFSTLLVKVAAVLTVSIFVINVAFSRPLIDALLFSLAIAIGITPQLLPAIVSVSLSSGSRALARKRVLVKRLVTIEDLGNIEVLFTDKTGTLTEGAITFHEALDPGRCAGARDPLLSACVCNEATMTAAGPVGGNALDVALLSAPAAAPLQKAGERLSAYERLGLLPFDHERQLASVVVRTRLPGSMLVTKGAPEAVLARCADVPPRRRTRCSSASSATARASSPWRRARRPDLTAPTAADEHDLELAGFLDVRRPPQGRRRRRRRASSLGSASTVKVITGDNGTVAAKVCRDIGIDGRAASSRGAELDALDDDALAAAIPGTTIFARVGPDQKSRHRSRSRAARAPTSRSSATGSTTRSRCTPPTSASPSTPATDVAKDAADIVLLDKDLGVLADGVVRRPAHLRQHAQVRADGDVVELRQHVQRRRRIAVPVVPADAAVADPAQQPALRRRPDGDPERPGRRGDRRAARRPGTSGSSAGSWPSSGRSARSSTS